METDRNATGDSNLPKKEDNGESNYAGGQSDYRQSDVMGSEALPPVFLGNLMSTYSADAITELFERPIQPSEKNNYYSVPVDKIDLKRGYAFVFLKDAKSQADKDNVEGFVMDINGMEVANVSQSLRAEFARGDGRVKKKEDERRRNIQPSETLFVVNFHEETTRQSDLQMLFEPYGELVRIDMKRNYAFVQFKNVTEAILAKEKTNGGKLDQSVLTVEFVARQRRPDDPRGPRDDRRRNDHSVGGGRSEHAGRDSRGHDRYDDRRRDGGGGRGRAGGGPFDSRNGGEHDDRRGHHDDGAARYDRRDHRTREASPYRQTGPRSRSRSRSPIGGRYRSSRSPPFSHRGASFDRRPGDRYDEYKGGGVRGPSSPGNEYGGRVGNSPPRRGPSPPPARGRPSPPRDSYRGDRDHRGYRH